MAAVLAGPLVVAPLPLLGGSETLAVGALLAVAVLAALLYRSRRVSRAELQRQIAFALPGAALYASVAWTRAWLVGVQSLAQVAATNRYHYAATALILSSAVALLARRAAGSAASQSRPLWSFACAALASTATNAWASQRCEVEGARADAEFRAACERSIESLARSGPAAETLFVENHLFLPSAAMFAMGVPLAEFPNLGAWWWIRFGARPIVGREIRFVERDSELLRALRESLEAETAQIFASPEDVARAGGRILALPDYAEIAQRWRSRSRLR